VSPIFQPWQVWWFFGHHGALVHGLFGAAKPGYRVAPQWTSSVARPLVLLSAAAVAGALWLARRRLARREALLALALVLLLRCVLDTWDSVPYTIGFILALLAWESVSAPRRVPLLATLATLLVWASFEWLPHHGSPDAQAALFLCWSLALAAWLALRLRASGSHPLAQARDHAAAAARFETSTPITFRRRLRALHAKAFVSSIV